MSREQAAAELRTRINAAEPDLLSVIDGLKDTFGARLKFIKLADGYVAGKEGEYVEGIVPTPYTPGLGKRSLKEAEQDHIEAHAKQAGAAARRSPARGRRK
jgi:hypothetical protein